MIQKDLIDYCCYSSLLAHCRVVWNLMQGEKWLMVKVNVAVVAAVDVPIGHSEHFRRGMDE
jgi:hypothetical protein